MRNTQEVQKFVRVRQGQPTRKFSEANVVIHIPRKARVQDYAVAAARSSRVTNDGGVNHFGPFGGSTGDSEPWFGDQKIPTNTSSEKGAGIWDFLEKNIGSIAGGVTNALANKGKADASAGKGANIGALLGGLSEQYIAEVVAKYKSGASLTEFERRIAQAAISIEGTVKQKAKQKAGEWIVDHLPEIGIGVGVLILAIILLKRR